MKTLQLLLDQRIGKLFPWNRLDRENALARPDILDLVREACLIESYFAIYTARMMKLFWYDVDATSTLSIETFEAFVHFATLRKYLDLVGYRPVTDEEIRSLREKDLSLESGDELEELVNFMATEHFAANFFRDIQSETSEPLLQAIMARFAPEEESHSNLAADLIERRLSDTPGAREKILRLAKQFRHVGSYVLPAVSNVNDDNVSAIVEFDRKIESLVGTRLVQTTP